MERAPALEAVPELAALRLRAARVRLYVASLLVDAATYGFSTALSCHAKEQLGADYWQLGQLAALSALGYSLTCLLSGGLSDRLGSMPLALVSILLLSGVMAGTSFAASYQHLLLGNALMGVSLALFWPPILRKLSRLSPGQELWGALGTFNVYWAVGVGAATLFTPWLYARTGLPFTLTAAIAVLLAAGLLLAIPMAEPRQTAGPMHLDGEVLPPGRARLFLRLAWVANFAAFLAMVGIMRVFPRISGDMGIPIEDMGHFLVPLDVGKIAAFVFLARYPRWHYSFWPFAAAQGVAGLALVAAGSLQAGWLFMLLFPLVGAVSGFTYFSSIYYGLNLREGEGQKSGLHETILAGGVCLGPLLCGAVGTRFPDFPGAAIIFGGLVLLAGLFIQLWLYRGASGDGSRSTSGPRTAALPEPPVP